MLVKDLGHLKVIATGRPEELNDSRFKKWAPYSSTQKLILDNIPPERRNKADRLLQFLAHAERPLTLQEAVDAIAARIDHARSFNTDDRFILIQLTSWCTARV